MKTSKRYVLSSLALMLLFICQTSLTAGELRTTSVFPLVDQQIQLGDTTPLEINVMNFNDQFNVTGIFAGVYFFRDGVEVLSYTIDLEPSTLTPGQSANYLLGEIDYTIITPGDYTIMIMANSPDNQETQENKIEFGITVTEFCGSDPKIDMLVLPNNGFVKINQSGDLNLSLTNQGLCVTQNLTMDIQYWSDTVLINSDSHILMPLDPMTTRMESFSLPVSSFGLGAIEVRVRIYSTNDTDTENNTASSFLTITPLVTDYKVSSVEIPECTFYDQEFNVGVVVENSGDFEDEDITLRITFDNTTNEDQTFEFTSTAPGPGLGNSETYDLNVASHIGMEVYAGNYLVTTELMAENDTFPEGNTAFANTKIVLTREAIAEKVKQSIGVGDNLDAMTHLSASPYAPGTVFQEWGNDMLSFTADRPLYVAFKDFQELAMLEHHFEYEWYDEFGNMYAPMDAHRPMLVDGELEDYDPFNNQYYIDGTPVEKEIGETPEDFINSNTTASGPTIDPEACVILVSGERKEYTDIAFDNDIDLLEDQLKTEEKGHQFSDNQIIKLKSPTPAQLDSVFDAIKNASLPNKSIYFIYTGHGLLENGGSIVLESPDLDEEFAEYSYEKLAKGLKSTGAPKFRVIIDACYSGLAVDKFSDAFFDPAETSQRLSLFTSAKDSITASSVRLKVDGERRYYSQYLFRWMQGYGAYDPNMDGKSSFEECHLFTTFSTALITDGRSDERSLWRYQEPWSYKNGNELLAEGTDKQRLGDSHIEVIRRIQGFLRDGRSGNGEDDLIIGYKELMGLPPNIALGEGVEEVIDYRHWDLELMQLPESTVVDLFISPEVDFGFEHDLNDLRNLGLVSLENGMWEVIPTEYNPSNGEVIVRDFKQYGIIALAYTDASTTTSVFDSEVADELLSVFPNPFEDQAVLKWIGQDLRHPSIEIYNISGLLIDKVRLNPISSNEEIQIGNLLKATPGLYIVIIQDDFQNIGSTIVVKK